MEDIDCVMVIDDDDISNYLVKKTLTSMGKCKKIICFSNGKYALDYLKQMSDTKKEIPSRILLDLNMPVMDGFDFLKEIFKVNASVDWKQKIIAISTAFNERDTKVLDKLGFSKRLVKPLKATSLLALF